jgi:predicted alpha-1,6-mannanase (GH76 family)
MKRCLLVKMSLILSFLFLPFSIFSTTTDDQTSIQQATNVLFNKYYINNSWNNTTTDKMGFWVMANIEETIINLQQANLINNAQLASVNAQIQANPLASVAQNNWNDDQLWWALMLLRAYEILPEHNPQFLLDAETIVANVRTSSPTNFCGNGVTWKNKNSINYKNTITNELFMLAAAKIAWLEKDSAKQKQFTQYAVDEWHWFFDKPTFSNYNLLNTDNSFNDGYKYVAAASGNVKCFPENTVGQVWTYNQGVILGALLYLLHDIKSLQVIPTITDVPQAHVVERKLLDLINYNLTSDRIINNYHDNLFEQNCEVANNCNGDQQEFKGIFMRYLAYVTTDVAATSPLHQATAIKLPRKLMQRIKIFSKDNAASIVAYAKDNNYEFDVQWGNPAIHANGTDSKTLVTATTDASAIAALLADYKINT